MKHLKTFEGYQLSKADRQFYDLRPENVSKKAGQSFSYYLINALTKAKNEEERARILKFYYQKMAEKFGKEKAMHLLIKYQKAADKELIKRN